MFDQHPKLFPDAYFGLAGKDIDLPYSPSTIGEKRIKPEFMGSTYGPRSEELTTLHLWKKVTPKNIAIRTVNLERFKQFIS